MKSALLGVMIAVGGVLAVVPGARAQGYGYGYGPSHGWEDGDWQRRMERREQRHAFWRERREMEARRAYEAGRRDAYGERRPSWGYR